MVHVLMVHIVQHISRAKISSLGVDVPDFHHLRSNFWRRNLCFAPPADLITVVLRSLMESSIPFSLCVT